MKCRSGVTQYPQDFKTRTILCVGKYVDQMQIPYNYVGTPIALESNLVIFIKA